MVKRSSRQQGGLTLLEAVLALVILSGVMVVSLQVRAQSMLVEQRLSDRHREHRAVETILRELDAGVLGEPVVDRGARSRTWTGSRAGQRFTLRSVPIVLENPALGSDAPSLRQSVTMWRYELKLEDQTIEFLHYR